MEKLSLCLRSPNDRFVVGSLRRVSGLSSDLFEKWLEPLPTEFKKVTLYGEREGARALGLKTLKKMLADHFVGQETIVKAGGYKKAAEIIASSLPDGKKIRSGDLGELLATEYVNSETSYVVPIRKLRWKDDRQVPMRGNDVVGVDVSQRTIRVLKCECKSRANLDKTAVEEASETLDLFEGRPNPSTLAFIAKRLYEEGRDSEGDVFRDLLTAAGISSKDTAHLIFALSGNNPSKQLASGPKSKHAGIERDGVAIMIKDHGAFVAAVYATHGT